MIGGCREALSVWRRGPRKHDDACLTAVGERGMHSLIGAARAERDPGAGDEPSL